MMALEKAGIPGTGRAAPDRLSKGFRHMVVTPPTPKKRSTQKKFGNDTPCVKRVAAHLQHE